MGGGVVVGVQRGAWYWVQGVYVVYVTRVRAQWFRVIPLWFTLSARARQNSKTPAWKKNGFELSPCGLH
jgi:hypothetical protein